MGKERPVVATGDAVAVGSRIRIRRQALGLRLATMARDLGYDRGYLSRVENGKARPSPDLLARIADYLELSIIELEQAPVQQLVASHLAGGPAAQAPTGLAYPALPPKLPPRKRGIGERVERLVAMAHLSPKEEDLIGEALLGWLREALALAKALRRIGDD
jgi:transcriptional regulator with XRE-family HTH domain